MAKTTSDNSIAAELEAQVSNNTENEKLGPNFSSPSQLQEDSRTQVAIDWTGPQDPENPQNWSKNWKFFQTFALTYAAFASVIASSLYIPGIDSVEGEFNISSIVAVLPFALYVQGQAVGPLVAGPCSERLGRKPVFLLGAFFVTCFTVGAGFSQSPTALIVCRFFAGVSNSPATNIGSAALTDFWSPTERASPIAIYSGVAFLGPALGPVVGGYVATAYDWRWTQWTIIFFTLAALLLLLPLRESYKPIILRNRSLKESHGFKKLLPDLQLPKRSSMRTFLRQYLDRPFRMLFMEPVVAAFSIYLGFTFGVIYGFYAAFPYVFATTYGLSIQSQGLSFLGLGVGVIFSIITLIVMNKYVYFPRVAKEKRKHGKDARPPAEVRLYAAMVGGPMMAISLFWFAWTAQPRISLFSPIIAESFFGFGNVLFYNSASQYLMDTYGAANGASALAATGFVRCTMAMGFSLFILPMYKRLGTGWASSVLGFIALGLSAIPWVLYRWGPALRQRVKYRTWI